jgi:hypothetical protein
MYNLLFDTFVPISSIITISIVVGYTLPRHQFFGLCFLLCWTIAVIISLAGAPADTDTKGGGGGGGLFNTGGNDTKDRIWGIVVLVGIPLLMLLILLVWWKKQEEDEQESSSSSLRNRNRNRNRKQQRRFHITIKPIRNFTLKYVPLWSMVAIHIYRLDGLSVVIPFWYNKRVPKFIGYQTIILDVIIGLTAIPFTYILYSSTKSKSKLFRSKRSIIIQQRPSYYGPSIKDVFLLWNSIGLYDLCSGYIFLIMNILNIGGPTLTYITEPSLLPQLGKHPFPLLLLFQVPLAISIHILLLTNLDEIIKVQSLGMMNNNNDDNNGQLVLPR